jgi:hypothetical protein
MEEQAPQLSSWFKKGKSWAVQPVPLYLEGSSLLPFSSNEAARGLWGSLYQQHEALGKNSYLSR